MSIQKKPKIKKKIRYAEYYDMTATFDALYADSQQGKVFTGLMDIITSEGNIKLAYRSIKGNRGSNTAGTDGKTINDVKSVSEQAFVEAIRNRLRYYKPQLVKRVEIPKPDGRTRPLGIPTIWDRLVQQCILQVLEPICEAKFHERSNGFRPNRSAHHAMAQCYRMIQKQGLHFVVDIDISGFFDNVNHHKLKSQIWNMGIRDKKLICIISEMLKAPILMPNGEKVFPTKGTPQGGILSPLLSNIVLNELDWWVASQWEFMPTHYPYQLCKNINGSKSRTPVFSALRKSQLKEMYIVRYADDFKIFCRTRQDAVKVFHAVKQWLKERLKLDINEQKSKVINLRRHYSEFLGFKLKAVKKAEKYVVKSHMKDKAIKKETENLKKIIKHLAHPKDNEEEYRIVQQYNSTVFGIHNYYRVATHISYDCGRITYQISRIMKQSLGKRLKKTGELTQGYLKDRYGKSKQLRYVHKFALAPIGFIRTLYPVYKKREINKYTPQGRAAIHRCLGVNMAILIALMQHPVLGRSVEYADNRISLYAAQKGRCAITGRELSLDEIHCHHKKPVQAGGTDSYFNLVIVHVQVHRLIHATDPEKVKSYLADLDLSPVMLKKVNKFREMASLKPVS